MRSAERDEALREGVIVLARPKGLKPCPSCGLHFVPSYPKTEVCPDCRESGANLEPVACDWCGEEFQPRSPRARYCSDSHRQMAYEKRKREHAQEAA